MEINLVALRFLKEVIFRNRALNIMKRLKNLYFKHDVAIVPTKPLSL